MLRKIGGALVFVLLLLWAVVELYPILFMFYSSVKSHEEIIRNPLALPTQLHFENFVQAWQGGAVGIPVGRYFLNSLVVVTGALLATMLLATMGGYALSRYSLRGAGAVQRSLVVLLAIPTHALLIPVFLFLGKLELRNTYPGLILVYTAFWLPFVLLLMRSYFDSFPKDLEDAARIDGCSDLGTFLRIVLPISRGAIAGASIINVVGMWSELLFSIVLMNRPEMKTLTVGILSFRGLYTTPWGVLMAGLTLCTLPPIVAFLIFQSKITKGMALGAFR